eukprot:3938186-Rhodomonas_salina.2
MPNPLQLQLRALESRKKKVEEELNQGRVIYGAAGTSYSPQRKKYKDEQVALLEVEIEKLKSLYNHQNSQPELGPQARKSMKSAEAGML